MRHNVAHVAEDQVAHGAHEKARQVAAEEVALQQGSKESQYHRDADRMPHKPNHHYRKEQEEHRNSDPPEELVADRDSEEALYQRLEVLVE